MAIPGATSRSLYLEDVTWEDAGSYRLVASNAEGSTFSDAISVALPFDYEDWLVERSPFTEEELADPEMTAPLARPFGDNITNLARYGFALASIGDLRGLPKVGIETVDGYGFNDRYLTVTFSRPTGAGDIAYEVESSLDLSDWQILAGWKILASEVHGETEWVTIRDNTPIPRTEQGQSSLQSSRQFLRVRVGSN